MKSLQLFVSLQNTILGSLLILKPHILLLIMIIPATLLTLTKAKENKYPLLKNLSVLKYV